MIRSLRVRNLAVIEELRLELGAGLNVVTGETGTGKSVLVAGLALLRGDRVSADVVRAGADEASVEAILEDEALAARAVSLGLAEAGDGELLVARTIAAKGGSRAWVNGSLATARVLARLLGDVVEVTGQGEHVRLLQRETQAALLDAFAGVDGEVGELSALHSRWVATAREIVERRTRAEELLRREDRLRFEIDQIRSADPKPDETESCEVEARRLRHADRLGRDVAGSLDALEQEEGIRDRLGRVEAAVERAARLDPGLAPPLEALGRAALEIAEAAGLLRRYGEALELDPERLAEVESRLTELRRLQDRYGPTVEAVLGYCRAAEEELARLGGGEDRLRALEEELAALGEELARRAASVSEHRRKGAEALSRSVQGELAAVDLARARLGVRFDPVRPRDVGEVAPPCGPLGAERAELWLAANPGEGERRLREAASGGELARVLLALRTVLRDADRRRILLFDEVDAGIGGRTARRVGERLRGLGRGHQVVCVTHLPQIAALGDLHFRIEKTVRAGRTRTVVSRLCGEPRVEEIARMAAGGRLTRASVAHARELLKG